MDLQIKLSDSSLKEYDIDAIELDTEIENISVFLEDELGAFDVLQFILKNELTTTFPNLTISLRILLTLPVTVAAGERSFSKLKLIKNYLRSSMCQERLNSLAILSIENEILKSLNKRDIIKEFATKKARKVNIDLKLIN